MNYPSNQYADLIRSACAAGLLTDSQGDAIADALDGHQPLDGQSIDEIQAAIGADDAFYPLYNKVQFLGEAS